MILAGCEPDLKLMHKKKKWPLFKVFSAKGRLKQAISSFLRDADAAREAVQLRLNKEGQEVCANRLICEGDNRKVGDRHNRRNERSEKAENEELALAYGTTPNDVKELRETFNLVDNDGGGTIDSKELARLLDILLMHREGEEIQELIDRVTSGMKEISFTDYIKA